MSKSSALCQTIRKISSTSKRRSLHVKFTSFEKDANLNGNEDSRLDSTPDEPRASSLSGDHSQKRQGMIRFRYGYNKNRHQQGSSAGGGGPWAPNRMLPPYEKNDSPSSPYEMYEVEAIESGGADSEPPETKKPSILGNKAKFAKGVKWRKYKNDNLIPYKKK